MELAAGDPRFKVVGALENPSHPAVGKPISQFCPSLGSGITVSISSRIPQVEPKPKILVDFTHPTATLSYLKDAQALGIGLVIGTTGFDDSQKKQIRDAAKKIPVLMASNFSLGMNLLFALVEEAAGTLGADYDVEITEAHHNLKKDAPSGSALSLGESVAKAWNVSLKDAATHGRVGQVGERKKGTIGFHAVRGGDIVGDHTVLYAGKGERLELTHRAQSREAFARGALKAALFLSGKKKGFYEMRDVLGLRPSGKP